MIMRYNFVPSSIAPFQFQPTLDGQVYNVVVNWNLYGQRYYVNIYDLSGALVVCLPLIGSPTALTVQNLSWSHGQVTLATFLPHGFKIGKTITMTVSDALISAYNGTFQMLIDGPSSMVYAIADDPGQPLIFGSVAYDISMTAGYFNSKLIFRESSRQFEVSS